MQEIVLCQNRLSQKATKVPSLEVLKDKSEKQLSGTVQVYLFLSSNREKAR